MIFQSFFWNRKTNSPSPKIPGTIIAYTIKLQDRSTILDEYSGNFKFMTTLTFYDEIILDISLCIFRQIFIFCAITRLPVNCIAGAHKNV